MFEEERKLGSENFFFFFSEKDPLEIYRGNIGKIVGDRTMNGKWKLDDDGAAIRVEWKREDERETTPAPFRASIYAPASFQQKFPPIYDPQ